MHKSNKEIISDFFERQKEKEKDINNYWKKYDVYLHHKSNSMDSYNLLRMITNSVYDSVEFKFKISMNVQFVNCFGRFYIKHSVTFSSDGISSTTIFTQECVGKSGDGCYVSKRDIPNLFAYSYLYLKIYDDKEYQDSVECVINELSGFITKRRIKTRTKPVCYLMVDGQTNYVKIGFSINPEKREKTLQSEKPSIKMIHIFKENHERTLHGLFSDKRVRGEWFNLTEKDIFMAVSNFN